MTPKEKAKELWYKFAPDSLSAKDCAIICVEEVMEAIDEVLDDNYKQAYWLEVKAEIEKM